ncbi:hypothetical protein TNCT_669321 [Trichonephila clavata]|uniref:Uncharacterized protein n=1 Tax=Trichonephila clavata TaxID=2740835 RepID=A0A8X6FU10_TRICU|nr:hypothetical protein TNCT_669321 [Trichonephila clavata]
MDSNGNGSRLFMIARERSPDSPDGSMEMDPGSLQMKTRLSLSRLNLNTSAEKILFIHHASSGHVDVPTTNVPACERDANGLVVSREDHVREAFDAS